jgi:hypothetical protein
MEKMVGAFAWVAPIVAMVRYLLARYRRIDDRSEHVIATDLAVFPLSFVFLAMISMGGAFAIGSAVRTATIGIWLALVIGWVGLHALRWKPKLRLASLSLFIGLSAILVFVAYQYFLRTADKVFRSAVVAGDRGDCRANLTDLGKAMLLYAEDNDHRLPVTNWTDAIDQYTKPEVLHCPTSNAAVSYTMNSEAHGISSYESAPDFVIAFDGFGGENQTSAGPRNMRWAHLESASVLMITGKVELLPPYRMYDYIWDRETALSPDWEAYLRTFERK